MQVVPPSAAVGNPVERAKADTEVRVLQAFVDDLIAEHAKEAESYKRWQARCTNAENAELRLEYTIQKSRSAENSPTWMNPSHYALHSKK